MPSSPKPMVPVPWAPANETTASYLKTPLGIFMALLAIGITALIFSEISGLQPANPGVHLGRRGIHYESNGNDHPQPENGLHPENMRGLEVQALYRSTDEQSKQIADLQAENALLKERLYLVTGEHLPQRAAPLGLANISDVLATVRANPLASKPSDKAAAALVGGDFNGGASGVDFPGFSFFRGQDFDGGDLAHYDTLEGNLPKLAALCMQTPACVAFNSQGWLKDTILPRSKWYTWSHVPDKGIFIKTAQAAKISER